MLAESKRHDLAMLNGTSGMASLYDEVVLASVLARRGVHVLLAECIYEPGSRALGPVYSEPEPSPAPS